ncbi:LytTR family DNA-binding domain-containing protein [Sedimentitalea sp.]|uniref:LytTR family DNA-binding domain-containing protein n=1 Tax=Sedimentitalea sp. TaxID=2048915 RepID=UPI0032971483
MPLTKRFNLLVLLLVSFLGATMGPFGTYEAHSLLHRMLYWSSVSAASIVIGSASRRASRRYLPRTKPILQDLLMIALTVVFFTPPLWFLTSQLAFQDPSLGPPILRMSYYVAAITLSVCVLRRIFPGFEPVGYFGEKTPEQPEGPRLTRRLSPEFQGPILRISVRDHFVDVISASSIETIRMRFADAIEEMDTVEGYTTHRSHWVAQDAISGTGREAGKTFLTLTNGDQIPVSRKYKPMLEEAGVISN